MGRVLRLIRSTENDLVDFGLFLKAVTSHYFRDYLESRHPNRGFPQPLLIANANSAARYRMGVLLRFVVVALAHRGRSLVSKV